MKNANKNLFDYEQMVTNSLIYVVKQALEVAEVNGLLDGHYFNITFLTQHPDVQPPDFVKEEYPEEITIVLQYEFENLTVDENGFAVLLSFSGIPANVYVPFSSIRFFVDPKASFGLQFNPVRHYDKPCLVADSDDGKVKALHSKHKNSGKAEKVEEERREKHRKSKKSQKNAKDSNNVIDFSSLRKK